MTTIPESGAARLRDALSQPGALSGIQGVLLEEAARVLEGAREDLERFVPVFTEQLLYAQMTGNEEVIASVLRQMRLVAEARRIQAIDAAWDTFRRIAEVAISAVLGTLLRVLPVPPAAPAPPLVMPDDLTSNRQL